MKFKNYLNSLTGDNRIFSNKEIANMSVKEAFGRQDEILAQHSQIGIPSEKELRNSDNVVYVHAYTREDGTEVKAHWRSKPDGVENNNLSINSSAQSGKSTGGASELENDLKYSDITTGEPIVDVSTPEKVQKLMYPDEIAGVKRGNIMTYNDVARKGVNPSYENDIEQSNENSNCHACTLACECCRRGYSVNASSTLNNKKAEELAHNAFDLWIEKDTGKSCKWSEVDLDKETTYDCLNRNIKQGERYELGMYPQLVEGDVDTINGHVVCVDRSGDGQLRIIDPQRREYYIGNEQVRRYLHAWVDAPDAVKEIYPKFLRVDNKIINPYYLDVLVP